MEEAVEADNIIIIDNGEIIAKRIKNGDKIFAESTEQATDLICKYQDIFNDYEVIKGRMDDVFLSDTGI